MIKNIIYDGHPCWLSLGILKEKLNLHNHFLQARCARQQGHEELWCEPVPEQEVGQHNILDFEKGKDETKGEDVTERMLMTTLFTKYKRREMKIEEEKSSFRKGQEDGMKN